MCLTALALHSKTQCCAIYRKNIDIAIISEYRYRIEYWYLLKYQF